MSINFKVDLYAPWEKARFWCSLLSPKDIEIKNFVFLSSEELLQILTWRNHPDISRFMFRKDLISREEHFSFVMQLHYSKHDFYYLLILQEDPLGVFSLSNVNWENMDAEFGLYCRPDKKGYGNLLLEMLEYVAFVLFKLRKLIAKVFSYNKKALALYERFGYKIQEVQGEIFILAKNV